MTDPVRVLVVGVGNMGHRTPSPITSYDGFELVGLMSRSIKPQGPAGRARRLAALRGFRRALAETQPGRGLDQHLAEYPCRLRAEGLRRRLPCLHGKADRHQRRRCREDRRRGQGEEPQAGHRLHPARPPLLDQVRRGRAHPRQAAGDAHEPQPAEQRAGLELAQEPDGIRCRRSSIAASTMSTSCAR